MQDAWRDDEIETLRTMWTEGCSAGQISHVLKGRTRSAVIGKVHRLKLPVRACDTTYTLPRAKTPRPVIRDRLVPLSKRRQILAQRKVPEPAAARLDNGALIGTADLRPCHCRWPHGEVGAADFHYCGQPPKAGSPWCEVHAARATAIPYLREVPEDCHAGSRADRQFAGLR